MTQIDFTRVIPIVIILAGCVLLVKSYLVGIKKKTKFIKGLDQKKLENIKNIDKIIKEYSIGLVLMACACFTSVIFLINFGTVGKVVSLILLLISSINLSRVTIGIDSKFKKNI